MRDLTIIGIDIAKNRLQIHGKNSRGRTLLKKSVARGKFLTYMSTLPKCLVGMETCGGANYWGQELTKLGFDVKLMSPRAVKRCAGHQKNDDKDAEACCIAVSREDTRFVPLRNQSQMDTQGLHRLRTFYIKHKVALMNMIRGLLLENGIAIKKGEAALIEKIEWLLCSEGNEISEVMKSMLRTMYQSLEETSAHLAQQNVKLEKLIETDEVCQRLLTLPGIGPITASAMISKVGNGCEFKNGRELSAYFGLVPKQHSSGDKKVLGRITKNGDRYIRQLLIHGGRSAIRAAFKKNKKTGTFERHDEHSLWMRTLSDRVGKNKAAVAVANKNARIIVGLLKGEVSFEPKLAHGNF